MSQEFPDSLHVDTDNDSDLVRTLRAALRAKDGELSKAVKRAETAEKQSRSSTLADILREKKLSPKVAKLIPADTEPTAEAVGAWLEEFGDVFGIQQDAETGGNGDNDDEGGDGGESTGGGLSAEGAAAYSAAQQTEASGQAPAVIGLDAVAKVMDEAKGLEPEAAFQKLKEAGLVA